MLSALARGCSSNVPVSGWLFDQGMAGWEVNVLTVDHSGTWPLRILGALGHDPTRCATAVL